MAECALAVSFAPLNTGFEVDVVSRKRMSEHLLAEPVVCEDGKDEKETLLFVDCGSLLPSYEMCIRDARGFEVNERCLRHDLSSRAKRDAGLFPESGCHS